MTTDLTPQFTVDTTNETAAAVEAGQRIGRPVDVGYGVVTTLNPITGETTLHDLTKLVTERGRETAQLPPIHKTGTARHDRGESFIAYVKRHSTPGTEIWASESSEHVVAILDGDTSEQAGHSGHKATLTLTRTDAWNAWSLLDGKYIDQEAFAEHIEARSIDIIEPSAAELLEIVSTIKQVTQVDFESAKRLSDGQTVLSYRETSTASAGAKGEFAVPDYFVIGVSPFEGTQPYRVVARLRTRVRDGRLHLGIVLERPNDVRKAAFAETVKLIGDNLPEHPLFTGGRTL